MYDYCSLLLDSFSVVFSSSASPKARYSSFDTLVAIDPLPALEFTLFFSSELKFIVDFDDVIFDFTALKVDPTVFSTVLK